MAEVVLFHHSGGVTAGVTGLAETLRGAGHVVHVPDLFEGRTFADVADGVAFAERLGEDVFAARAAAAVVDLPADVVYVGASFGAARAAEQVLARTGARAAFFLYGAVAPSWWGATWPAGVPAQAHVAASDPWREPDVEEEFVATVPGAELVVHPVAGHLFAEPGHPDFDPGAALRMTQSLLAFLGVPR